MFPIHVINRDCDVERWNLMKKELEKQNITHAERYKANEYSLSNIPDDFFSQSSLPQIQKLLIPRKFWNWSALGCWNSHYSLWKTISEPTIIFEDDIIFNPNVNFLQEVEKIIQEIGEDNYDAILFYPNKKYKFCSETNLKYSNKVISKLFTTFGYIIHPNFIKKLMPFSPTVPFDIQVQNLIYKRKYNVYISKTNLIYTDCSPQRPSTIRSLDHKDFIGIKSASFDKSFFKGVPFFVRKFNLKHFQIIFREKTILDVYFDIDNTNELCVNTNDESVIEKFMRWVHSETHSMKF